MSACDHLLMRRVVLVTRRRQLGEASKVRIRTLVRNVGAGWKGEVRKSALVN